MPISLPVWVRTQRYRERMLKGLEAAGPLMPTKPPAEAHGVPELSDLQPTSACRPARPHLLARRLAQPQSTRDTRKQKVKFRQETPLLQGTPELRHLTLKDERSADSRKDWVAPRQVQLAILRGLTGI